MTAVRFAVTLALLSALLVLAVQNPQPVAVNFLRWKMAATSVLSILLAGLIVGIVCGFFMGWSPRRAEPPADDETPPEEERE